MDNVSKEIKEYGMIKTFLPEATALERAVTYRDKKIKPLFIRNEKQNRCDGCTGERTHKRKR